MVIPMRSIAGGSHAEGYGAAHAFGAGSAISEHADSIRDARPNERGMDRMTKVIAVGTAVNYLVYTFLGMILVCLMTLHLLKPYTMNGRE